MALRIRAQNYRVLRSVDWSLEPGTYALVGPNGSGKSTLLSVPLLLKDAVPGVGGAMDVHGGWTGIVRLGAEPDAAAELSASVDDIEWSLEFRPRGAEVSVRERVVKAGELYQITERVESMGQTQSWVTRFQRVQDLSADGRPATLRELTKHPTTTDDVAPLPRALGAYRFYRGYSLRDLRVHGSQMSSEVTLQPTGLNVFSLLRNWRDTRANEPKYAFVIDGLREAFPECFADLEFDAAGQTVAARLFPPKSSASIGSYFAPEGWLVGLLHLAAVASTPDGGVVAIDEFENSLHPYAIRALLEIIEDYVGDHKLTLVTATHSPVLIDQFKARPSNLLVLDPTEPVLPVPLDKLRDPEWLEHFSLGDLYSRGEFGAQAAH